MSVNKAILVGRLGRDPEVRYNQNSLAICEVSIATSERRKGQNGQYEEQTEWHRVVFFDKKAEVVGQYLTKGSLVYVEGRLETRKYQDKQGIERYVTRIIADNMQMLGSKADNQVQQQYTQQNNDDFASQGQPPRATPQQQANAYAKATGGRVHSQEDYLDEEPPF